MAFVSLVVDTGESHRAVAALTRLPNSIDEGEHSLGGLVERLTRRSSISFDAR